MRRRAEREVRQPLFIAAPVPPDDLDPDERKVWSDLGDRLVVIGLLSEVDVIAFASFVRASVRLDRLNAELRQESSFASDVAQRLLTSIRRTEEAVHRGARQFGLTPAARAGLAVDVSTAALNVARSRSEDAEVDQWVELRRTPAELIAERQRRA